ncbi:HlyD family efflux transporter periplasmic adaptor subunit [Sulfitobacter porphyrae]|uniref:HlyD family efflux transporter periplasmic adaptor subunit n=1 Tax=Sulfitobacter porphyrae TaxID=1246864 RepID=A0ABW2B4Y8_9RHOB
MPARALGARVGKGEVLASVTDALADSVRLNDLLLEQDIVASEIARLSSDEETTRQILSGLEERASVYSRHRIAELEIRLQHARARLALIEDRGDAGDDNAAVDAVGADTGPLPGADRFPALALDHARERVEVLEVAVNAAKAGVFLGDGYNDAPNAGQRAVELRSEIAATQSSLAEAQARQAAVIKRIGRERERVNGLSGGDLVAPVNGLVWEVLAADGEHLERGDPVLKLVDCGSVMVNLSVSEGVYNTLSPGQSAEFRPMGGSQVFDATVLRLAGSGAATVYRNLAVAPSGKHLERYDVTLLVSGLKDDPELACAIGRTGRVFFDRRPLDWLRRLF